MKKYDRNYEMQAYKTEDEKLNAVKRDGLDIRFVRNPSEDIQLAAVKQNGNAIQCIKNPSEEVIRTAILNGALKKKLKHVDISNLSDETKLMIELM